VDVVAGQSANAVFLLEAASAMAGRKRRKVLPLSPFLTYVVSTMVAVIGVVALGYLGWRAWPAIATRWKARNTAGLSKKNQNTGQGKKVAAETPAEALSRLKKEVEALREENNRLREQIHHTSETLSQQNAELDELKLRILILEKTRSGQP